MLTKPTLNKTNAVLASDPDLQVHVQSLQVLSHIQTGEGFNNSLLCDFRQFWTKFKMSCEQNTIQTIGKQH